MIWLYPGRVHHARFGPKRHRLSYRIFMLLTDVDLLDGYHPPPSPLRGGVGGGGSNAQALPPAPPSPGVFPARGKRSDSGSGSSNWVLGLNRPSLLSLRASDYGDGSGGTVREQVERLIAANGLAVPGGAIRLLTMPRVLGRGFNPLSVYYCNDIDGQLAVVVYEVRNTFGARHHYVLPAARQHCGKAFFVSPFMDQDLAYAFDVAAPDDTAHIGIRVQRGEATVLTASFHGHRRPAPAHALLAAWLTHPWQTIGVLAAIYLEGAKLLLKGFRWRSPRSVETRPELQLRV